MPTYTTLTYDVRDAKAYVTLNRPDRLNAIDDVMPGEIRAAVEEANADDGVRVIVVAGAGRAFCAGYDLKKFAEGDVGERWRNSSEHWDPIRDYREMRRNTDDFFTLWRSSKPTIAKIHGAAVAGGSDIALCCDLIVMAEDARIGYMPTRVWGCPTTAMWTFRLGPARAKELMFTGNMIDGRTAAEWGLVNACVPADELESATKKLADRIAGVPKSHLAMHKMVVNQVMLNMGLEQTQSLATLFDGITRHNPEGLWFRR